MNPPIYFLVRAWKAYDFFDRCIDSIFAQKHRHYTILYVDDASPYSDKQKQHIKEKLREHTVIFNTKRKFAVRNAYETITRYVKEDDAIIINLDGDDWLIRPDVINIVLSNYKKHDCDFSYGNCVIYHPGFSDHDKVITDVDPGVNIRYLPSVEKNKSYRKEIFFPRHVRTWKASLYKKIPKTSFLYPNRTWLKTCEDEAIFFPMFELSGRYRVISTPLGAYNLSNPNADEKIHLRQRLQDEVFIRKQSIFGIKI